MSINGYYHPVPEDCGKEVSLTNPDHKFELDLGNGVKHYYYSPKRTVQMVITCPKGRMAIFDGCKVDAAGQAIKEFMEYHKDAITKDICTRVRT